MVVFHLKDKHFWKIIALILLIINVCLLTILGGVLFEGKIILKNSVKFQANAYSKDIKDVVYGDKNANLTVYLYVDFECPFCIKFHKKSYQRLKKEYVDTNKINLVIKHYPKVQVHKSSLLEAQAFECAKEQNRSYEIYDELFNEKRLTKVELLYIVQGLDLDIAMFEECLYLEKYKNDILESGEEAKAAGIESTPTLVIGNTIVSGVKPYSVLKEIIDDELMFGNSK